MADVAPHPLMPLLVTRSWDETPSLRGVELQAGAFAAAHTAPGQYLKVAPAPAVETFFAIASAPGRESFELLLKRGSPAADAIAHLVPGETLPCSAPQGKGFPVAAHEKKDLLFFAAGSGIAPIRSALQVVLERRHKFGEVTLYYGHREPEAFAYAGEFDKWRAGRITVEPVISGDGNGWSGHRGHVQDIVDSKAVALVNTVAFVCGMKPMTVSVIEALARRGLAREHVFMNY